MTHQQEHQEKDKPMLSKNAQTVLEKRYLTKGADGKPNETIAGMFMRVASTLAAEDRKYGADEAGVAATTNKFLRILYNPDFDSPDFLPNSPTLANAGARTGQLSACFVLPVDDDLAGIFNTMRDAALIHQTGGGTGFAFSRLRPKGDRVGSTAGEASGPVSFMDAYNAATGTIAQGGMRRGANMGILRIDHPDIQGFVSHKEDLSKLTNFNISVAVTDVFMTAVEAGTDYALINPRNGEEWGRMDARTVFNDIVLRAWSTGEPGIVFIDRMNRYCPVPWMGTYEATNPCGEQPLLPYESCNLGSVNLENFVTDVEMPDGTTQPMVNWDRLRVVVHAATHLMDNVIDANRFPIPELKAMSDATRKLGLGVMGFARMLFKMGIGYGSQGSFALAAQVMSFIDYESKVASVNLAKQRGSFPAREGHEEESNAFFQRICFERHADASQHPECNYYWLYQSIKHHGIRNSNTTTIAPTGTLSIIANTSGGCEPQFALVIERNQADTKMIEVDPVFLAHLKAENLSDEAIESVVKEVADNHGTLHGLSFSAFAKDVFKVAHDVTPDEHVRIQAAFQTFNDSATSKTINFAESATVEDVATAYRLAWQTGCKGITVYRNNCRAFQPLSTTNKEEAKPAALLVEAPVEVKEVCDNCGSDSLMHVEGCVTCACCAWSACSVA